LPKVNVERWITARNFDIFVGSHNGYQRLAPPALHRRWVIYFKPGWWIIRDQVLGEGSQSLDVAWHLPPHADTSAQSGSKLRIVPVADSAWKQESSREQYSPAYGRSVSAETIRFRYSGSIPAEFASLLVDAGPQEDAISFTSTSRQSKVAAYLATSPKAARGTVFGAIRASWEAGDWSSDAELLCYHVDGDGVRSMLLCNATFANWRSQQLFSSTEAQSICEFERREGTLHPVTSIPRK
jgi:hypothetical protein